MEYADGKMIVDYNGAIRANTRILVMGTGLMETGSEIKLDPAILRFMGIQIIKEEMKSVTLDLDQINKMLESSLSADKDLAHELLQTQTKYTSMILRSLDIEDMCTLKSTIDKYQNNNKKLSKDIL